MQLGDPLSAVMTKLLTFVCSITSILFRSLMLFVVVFWPFVTIHRRRYSLVISGTFYEWGILFHYHDLGILEVY